MVFDLWRSRYRVQRGTVLSREGDTIPQFLDESAVHSLRFPLFGFATQADSALVISRKPGCIEEMTNAEKSPFSGLNILVVEDEYLIANDVRRFLRRQDASVVGPCSSVTAARRALDRSDIDFAILDINLGDHDVLEFASELDRQGFPCLFLTGYPTSIVPDHLKHIPLVRKPCDDTELLAAALTRSHPSHAARGTTNAAM